MELVLERVSVFDASISIQGTLNPNHHQLNPYKVKVLYSSFTRAPVNLKGVGDNNFTEVRFRDSEIRIGQNHYSFIPNTLSMNGCSFSRKDIQVENMTEVQIRDCHFEHLKMKIHGYDLEKLEEYDKFHIATAKYFLFHNTFLEVKLKGKMVGQFSMESCQSNCSYFTIEGCSFSANTTQFMSSFSMENSHFGDKVKRGNCKVNQDDSFVTFQKALMNVSKSSFSMTQIIPKGFLTWKSNYLKNDSSQLFIDETNFSASEIHAPVPIIVTPSSAKLFEIRNVLVECSYRSFYRSFQFDVRSIIFCDINCNPGEYKIMNNKVPTVALVQKLPDLELSINQPQTPGCPNCPVGGVCKQNVIAAAPEYWGYKDKDKEQSFHMIRCPQDYCCSGTDQCVDIKSCNTGRIGTLCGSCKSDLTESLFSTTCVSADNCRTGLIAILFTHCCPLLCSFSSML